MVEGRDTEAEEVPEVRNDYVGEGGRGEDASDTEVRTETTTEVTSDEGGATDPSGPTTDDGPQRDAPADSPGIDTESDSVPERDEG